MTRVEFHRLVCVGHLPLSVPVVQRETRPFLDLLGSPLSVSTVPRPVQCPVSTSSDPSCDPSVLCWKGKTVTDGRSPTSFPSPRRKDTDPPPTVRTSGRTGILTEDSRERAGAHGQSLVLSETSQPTRKGPQCALEPEPVTQVVRRLWFPGPDESLRRGSTVEEGHGVTGVRSSS